MSVNEKMTAIADAIRVKTGETAPLSLDAMASAIAGIAGTSGLRYTNGTFEGTTTWSSTSATYKNVTVTHDLGVRPQFILIFLDDTIYTPTYSSSTSASYTQLVYSFNKIYKNESSVWYNTYYAAYATFSRFQYYSSASATSPSYTAKGSVSKGNSTSPLSSTSTYSAIKTVNDSTFEAPSYAYYNKLYRWYAFG